MKNLSVALGEALAEGAVIIPNVIFAGLIYQHNGNYQFLLPFVLLYSFEKAGVFAIQGFGTVKNPYKILECCLLTAITGIILCIFGTYYHYLWEIGAILVGIGLSNYTALFRTIRDILKNAGNWNYENALIKGYFILAVIMGFSIFLRHISINIIFIVFLVILLNILIFIHKLDSNSEMGFQPLFEKQNCAWLNFLPALGMLIFTFFTRTLKQTSDIRYILYVGFGFCILILIGAFLKKLSFHLHSIQTLWFGAVRNFLIIYSLIYFIAVDKSYMVGFSYAMIAIGIMLSITIKRKIKLLSLKINPEIICIGASMISLILLFSSYTYLLGIMFCCAFVATGNSFVLQKFIEDNTFPMLERRIIRSKFYGLGAIIQQAILLSILIVVSWIKNQNGSIALRAYALSNGTIALQSTFLYVKIICILFIILSGVYLMYYTRKKLGDFKK